MSEEAKKGILIDTMRHYTDFKVIRINDGDFEYGVSMHSIEEIKYLESNGYVILASLIVRYDIDDVYHLIHMAKPKQEQEEA